MMNRGCEMHLRGCWPDGRANTGFTAAMHYARCTIICTVHYAQCTMHYQYKLPWLPPTTDQTWVLLVLGRALCTDLQCITAQDWRFFDLSGTKSLGAFLPAGFKFSLQSDAMTLPLTNEFRDELNLQCTTQLKIWSGRGSWKPFSFCFWSFPFGGILWSMAVAAVSFETRKEIYFTRQLIMSLPMVIDYQKKDDTLTKPKLGYEWPNSHILAELKLCKWKTTKELQINWCLILEDS